MEFFFELGYDTDPMPTPAVILNPEAQACVKQGFDELASLLALTLGPTQGSVLNDSSTKSQPELLNDAATIARRIISLPDRRKDVGAMLLRQTVWRAGRREGDGTALTAVLAKALLQEAHKLMAAGGNPIRIHVGMRQAVDVVRDALTQQTTPATTADELTAVAQAVTGRRDLALVLGELYDLLGADAHVTIQDYLAPLIERTYLNGGQWSGKLISPYLQTAQISKQAIQTNCYVALFQGRLHARSEVEPLLNALLSQQKEGDKASKISLLVVAEELAGDALETLVVNHTNEESPLQIIGISLGVGGERGSEDLGDLAQLTGATALGPHIGRPLASIKYSELGQAGRVEAGTDHFLVVDGKGDRAGLQTAISGLQQRLRHKTMLDDEHKRLVTRLGRLTGNAAILKVGAATKAERTTLHQKAEHGLRAMAATVAEGYLPGGGIALHRCRPAVAELIKTLEGDARLGALAVERALSRPALQIMRNAGVESPEAILAHIDQMRHTHTEKRDSEPHDEPVFNVISGQIESAKAAGILDPTRVVRSALESAASGAMLALSVDAIVLNRKPETAFEP